jgi:DNA-binding response OmpR family regulator
VPTGHGGAAAGQGGCQEHRADDYLPKPFRMEELLARLRSVIRRSAGHASSVVSVGEVTLDERQMRVSIRGIPVSLSVLEYRLTAYLLRHRGRVIAQHELEENVYGHGEDHDSNALEVLIGRVRRKLGAHFIETRRGFGYVVPEPPKRPAA